MGITKDAETILEDRCVSSRNIKFLRLEHAK